MRYAIKYVKNETDKFLNKDMLCVYVLMLGVKNTLFTNLSALARTDEVPGRFETGGSDNFEYILVRMILGKNG